MIQKNIVEIFTLVLYWCIITPLIGGLCYSLGWIGWNENDILTSVKGICGLALGLAAGYLVVYLIVVLVYLRFKTWSMKVWHNYETTNIEMINAERAFYIANDPDAIYAIRPESRSTVLDMEEDEIDGHRAMPRAQNIPPYYYRRPVERVHNKAKKPKKPNNRPPPPPPYELPENLNA
ncbi:hypothetical protein ACLKA7_002201 [Drosophila subpalustris]